MAFDPMHSLTGLASRVQGAFAGAQRAFEDAKLRSVRRSVVVPPRFGRPGLGGPTRLDPRIAAILPGDSLAEAVIGQGLISVSRRACVFPPCITRACVRSSSAVLHPQAGLNPLPSPDHPTVQPASSSACTSPR
jgi:hypothetical protein